MSSLPQAGDPGCDRCLHWRVCRHQLLSTLTPPMCPHVQPVSPATDPAQPHRLGPQPLHRPQRSDQPTIPPCSSARDSPPLHLRRLTYHSASPRSRRTVAASMAAWARSPYGTASSASRVSSRYELIAAKALASTRRTSSFSCSIGASARVRARALSSEGANCFTSGQSSRRSGGADAGGSSGRAFNTILRSFENHGLFPHPPTSSGTSPYTLLRI